MNKVTVIPGVALPFFPMRPVTGPMLLNDSHVAEVLNNQDFYWQPKLGGDRVIMARVGNEIFFANRHGGWYSFNVENKRDWMKVPDRTVLDGEVYKKKFYAFECVVAGGVNMTRKCVTERAAAARYMSELCGVDFIFNPPTEQYLKDGVVKKPSDWEGVVGKRKNTPYVILGVKKDSPNWIKRKWIL